MKIWLILLQRSYPENKYYIFGEEGAKHLAYDLNLPFLGEIPIVQSVREAGDFGRPAALQENTPVELAFKDLSQEIVKQVVNRMKVYLPLRL